MSPIRRRYKSLPLQQPRAVADPALEAATESTTATSIDSQGDRSPPSNWMPVTTASGSPTTASVASAT